MNETLNKIADDYYGLVQKPEAALNQPNFCVMAVGLMRSGKTTAMKLICQQLPLVRFSVDEVRELLAKNGIDMGHTEEVSKAVVKKLLDQGYNIAFDTDMARPEKRALIVDYLKGRYRIFWIHVVADEKTLFKRLTKQQSELPWFSTNIDRAVRVQSKRLEIHNQPGNLGSIKFDFVFDSTKPNIDEQVDEFVKLVKKELHTNVASE